MVTYTFQQLYWRRARHARRARFKALNAACCGHWRNAIYIDLIRNMPRNRLRFDHLSGRPYIAEVEKTPPERP